MDEVEKQEMTHELGNRLGPPAVERKQIPGVLNVALEGVGQTRALTSVASAASSNDISLESTSTRSAVQYNPPLSSNSPTSLARFLAFWNSDSPEPPHTTIRPPDHPPSTAPLSL